MKFSESGEHIITIPKHGNCLVYFLIKSEEVVYVGQSKNGTARPFSHKDKDFDEIKIIYCTPDNINQMEDAFIQKYKPIYNRQSNYAERWSLLRVRNTIRDEIGIADLTVPKLKRLLKTLHITPEKDIYNGRESITFEEYTAVMKHIGE